MNTELVPFTTSTGHDRRESRAMVRQIEGFERSKTVALARVEAQAQIEAGKTHAVGFVGQQAMQAVAMVSQLEQQLGEACPIAVTRLQGIADMAALSMAQVVADTARKLG